METILTQQMYDARMSELNVQQRAELAPLRNEMERIEKERAIINQQMDQLRMKSRELGSLITRYAVRQSASRNTI